MSQGSAWMTEDDFELCFRIMDRYDVKASKELLKDLSDHMPGNRTPKAISRRLQKLQEKYKSWRRTNKAASGSTSAPTTPRGSKVLKVKRSSPLKGKGKKVAFSRPSTAETSPNQSDGELPMEPQRWSSRRGSKKSYAEIDNSESDGIYDGGTGEIAFENVEIKTEV